MRAFPAAWARLSTRPSRLVATIVAIVIGTGFAAAALVFTATFRADLAARLSVEYSSADLVVTPSTDDPARELAATIESADGVAAAEPLYDSNLQYTSPQSHGYLTLKTQPSQKAQKWATLTDGRWPTGESQIVLTPQTATAANLSIGSRLTLFPPDPSGPRRQMTVVGMADAPSTPIGGGELTAFVAPQALGALDVTFAPEIAVTAKPGVSATTLRRTVSRVVGDDGAVRTTAAQADHDLAQFSGQASALKDVLLVFAGIALVVAGIVISNTFAILMTQRRRQVALLRCVGASVTQVRREVVAEAALVGIVGSALGAGVGIGVGGICAAAGHVDSGGLVLPALGVVIVALAGVGLTVAAAVIPARRALRVPPIVALRPVADRTTEQRVGRVRMAVGIVLVAAGGLLLAGGVIDGSLVMAFPGGAVSAVGVLLLARSFLPALLGPLGGLGRVVGGPGRLAAANAVRNPGRAAATSVALVVGVGLIVMLQVAAASAGSSMDAAAADRYPVDVAVVGDGSWLPADVVAGVHATTGLGAVLDIPGASVTGSLADGGWLPGVAADSGPVGGRRDAAAAGDAGGAARGGGTVTLLGVPDSAGDVVRGDASVLQATPNGHPTVVVPPWWVGSGRVGVGDTITLRLDGRSQAFTVAVSRLDQAGVMGPTLITSRTALHAVAPHAPTVALWGALGGSHDAPAVMSSLNALLAHHPGLYANGSAADRASLQAVLSTVTTVAIGLLAVAVVIAVVGIANTIGLSVVERRRESALLRALGLRRGQLRLMLAIEALLLALVGTVVGVLLGLVYGWAGAAATFGQIGQRLVVTVPWGSVALVAVLALAAGALASVLPARRAATVSPAGALAEE